VEKMQESLNDAMDVAQQSEHPRAYEVVFNGARHTADIVEKITDLQKKMNDLRRKILNQSWVPLRYRTTCLLVPQQNS